MSGGWELKSELTGKKENTAHEGLPEPVRNVLTILVLSMAAMNAAVAQSSFIREGQSGWKVSGQFLTGSGATSGGITIGYSGKGLVDAVMSMSRSSFPNPYPFNFVNDGRVITGAAYSETFRTFIVKQGRRDAPVSLSLSAGCLLGSFSAPKSQISQKVQVDNGYMFYGASLSRQVYVSGFISIQPSVSFLYWEGFGSVDEEYYHVQAANNYARSLSANVSFSTPVSEVSTLVITPCITYFGRRSVVSIDAGFVFLTNDGAKK